METNLLKTLEEDTRAQVERILQEAREEALEETDKAEADGARMKDERLRAFYSEIEKTKAAKVNSARIHAGGLILKIKHELFEEAIMEAVQKIKSLPEKEYSLLIRRLFEELKSQCEKEGLGGGYTVIAGDKDLEIIKTFHKGKTAASKDMALGAALVSEDGRCRFENTIPGRIKKAHSSIVMELDKILFS